MRYSPLLALFLLAGCTHGSEGSPPSGPIEPGPFTAGDAASERLARELALDHLLADGDMLAGIDGIEPERVTIDRFGGAHGRFAQTVDGIPVLGGVAIVHLANDGTFAGYTDGFVRRPKVDTTPSLTSAQAVAVAVARVGGRSTVTGTPDASLVILPGPRGARLTWRVQIAKFEPGTEPAAPLVFVEAHSGKVLQSYDNLRSFPTSLTHETWDAHEHTTTDFSTYVLASPGDTIAETTHDNVGITLAYFETAHERSSYDGEGALVQSAVHYGHEYVNAFYYLDRLYFGDGDGIDSDALVSLDIVAHEFTHGVTGHTAGLLYQDETGALDEATSDIFAAAVEAADGGGFEDIWWVGEDVWLADDALRYMNDPAQGGDPDYYPDRYLGSADNGGVHWNSGIANLWFYLLSEGGQHPRDKTATEVTGIGIETAAAIWYDTLVHRLHPRSTFSTARAESIATAEADWPDAVDSVTAAWDAVGVVPVTVTVLSEVAVPRQKEGGEFHTSIGSSGNDAIRFDLDVPDGDADLYVRFGAAPTVDDYDCRPSLSGGVEECVFDPAQDGTWYAMVRASSRTSKGTLTISSIHYGSDCGDIGDTDGDGVCDDVDPCPNDNPDDWDGDGVCDSEDWCPNDNPDDTDSDGICDSDDICPYDPNNDSDHDGVCGNYDPCPDIPNDQDTDGDGVPDCFDACPTTPGDVYNRGCPTGCDLSGTIGKGVSRTRSLGNLSAGTGLSATLDWTPADANLDLYLEVETDGRWRTAASSRTSGFESIDYTVPGSDDGAPHRWLVVGKSGTAEYCLTDNL